MNSREKGKRGERQWRDELRAHGYLSTGGTGSVPCLAISDGTNWKQIAIGANAI